MNKTLMIILMIICALVLVFLIIALIPRIKAALNNIPLIAYIIMVPVLLGAITFLAVNIFGPKGSDSLSSAEAEGIEKGDAYVDTELDERSEDDGMTRIVNNALEGNESGDDTVYISVRGDKVRIGETFIETAEDLSAAVTALSDHPMCLVDDYGTAVKYKEVKEILDSRGIKYSEKTNP